MSRKKLLAICVASAVSSMANAQQAPEIQEISVIGQFVPDEKRATDQISNVIGEEQFTRAGDANIAEGLKRISGLSTVDGKFVYVRGLGERYSAQPGTDQPGCPNGPVPDRHSGKRPGAENLLGPIPQRIRWRRAADAHQEIHR